MLNCRNSRCFHLSLITTMVLFHSLSLAQPQASHTLSTSEPAWQTAAGGNMEFEVASVKPSAPGTPFSSNVPLNALDGPLPTGNFFSANAILMPYLIFAYKISDPNQGRGIWDKLPDWAKTQFFNIEARADGAPSRDQLRLMVQALLADRFKLTLHRELKVREEYSLVLFKPPKLGPQLLPHPIDELCEKNPNASSVVSAPAKDADGSRYCGMVTWSVGDQRHLRMIDVTMAQIADYLSSASMAGGSLMPHSGVDDTGLKGRYDLDLQFLLEPDGPGSNQDAEGPTFTQALRNQLGLKFVERKGPVEILVIDHLEKPSSNGS